MSQNLDIVLSWKLWMPGLKLIYKVLPGHINGNFWRTYRFELGKKDTPLLCSMTSKSTTINCNSPWGQFALIYMLCTIENAILSWLCTRYKLACILCETLGIVKACSILLHSRCNFNFVLYQEKRAWLAREVEIEGTQ